MVKVLENTELFESGAATAGTAAKRAKSNLQGDTQHPEVSGVIDKARSSLRDNAQFTTFALPLRFGRIMVSRYESGMAYGSHFDAAFIDGVRTDLSFTLFLSDPASYRGGELAIYSPAGSQEVKLPAGCVVVYPSDTLHAVKPVEEGTRLAVVGWLQSRIKSAEQRQLLYELTQATTQADAATDIDSHAITQLRHVRNNLLRMWSSN